MSIVSPCSFALKRQLRPHLLSCGDQSIRVSLLLCSSMICETCMRVFSKEIFTVPAPPNLITKRDVLNTDPQAYEEFPEDGQLYFVPHKSNYQDLYRSAELGCRCCVWLLAEEPHALLGRGNITSSCITQNPLDVFGFWVLRQDFGILHCILDFSRPSSLPHDPGTSSSILRFSTSHISDLRPTLAFEVVAAHGTSSQLKWESSFLSLTNTHTQIPQQQY